MLRAVIKEFETDAIKIATGHAKRFNVSDSKRQQGVASFLAILAFLKEHPESIVAVKEPFGSKEFLEKAAQRFFKGRFRAELPSAPTTVPDNMVSQIMQAAFGYSELKAKEIRVTHQQSMAAENAVGDVLERYIASVIEQHGWYWCSGTLVKAVDFLLHEKTQNKWHSLQIKNRDNSENSSSAAIRTGTTIAHWFRTFSRTGLTNWKAFPSVSATETVLLTEENFKDFVTKFYASLAGNP